MLTLVLTLAMLLSVMVVGAGAATFGDQDSITNKEAVDVCTTLNIIGGYEDGTFRPAGNVTRAEMSKMICVALNGGKEPSMGSNLINTFNDVGKDHWAAPYIEYCVSQGIVGGVGGGNFNPNGNITGTQAAKMLLCILGYNASIQGYVGNDFWETKINVDASQKHLYDGIETIDASAPLTRDSAARMIWNALQANEVEYKTTLVAGPDGTLTSKVTVQDKVVSDTKDNITLLEDKYGSTTVEGIVIAVDHNTKGYMVSMRADGDFTQPLSDPDTITLTALADDPTDLVGKAVKAMYKTGHRDEVYGIYVDSSETTVVAEGYIADLDLATITTKDTIKLDGTEYKTDGNSEDVAIRSALGGAFSNGDIATTATGELADVKTGINSDSKETAASKIVLIDNNGNEKIDLAIITPITIVKVGTVDGNDAYLSAKYGALVNNLVDEEDNVYSGIAKDDYALYIADAYTADDGALVTKANIVSGNVSSTKGTTDINIDGTWYTLFDGTAVNTLRSKNAELVTLGSNAIVVDTDGGSVSLSNLIYVQDAEVSTALGAKDQVKAIAYKPDGAPLEIVVSHIDGDEVIVTGSAVSAGEVAIADTAAAHGALADKLFTYTVSSGKYKLTAVDGTQSSYDFYADDFDRFDGKNAITKNGVSATVTLVPKGDVGADVNASSLRIDDNATIFVNGENGTSVKVISGSALKAWQDKAVGSEYVITGAALIDQSGYYYVKVATVTLTGEIPGASSDTKYGYIMSEVETIETDDGDKFSFTLWNGTDSVPATADANGTPLEQDMFIAYTLDGDDIDVSDTATISANGDYVTAREGNEFDLAGGKAETTYNLEDDDVVVIYVNTREHKGVATGEIARADETTTPGTYYENVVALYNNPSKDKVVALFVGSGNRLYIDGEAQTQ